MLKDNKKKKASSEGMTTREKMMERKKKLEQRGQSNGFIFCKEGVTRVRIKSPGPDEELGIELIQFYLDGLGSVYSPQTFGEPCPFMEKYLELKDSPDEDDKELAKKFIPKRRYVIGGIVYEDDKGKKVAYDGKDKAVLITRQVYQDIINLYLDEDEAGDMTDPKNGYDIKITRSGKGQMDTAYSVMKCKESKLDKSMSGPVNLEDMVKSQIKSYDELETLLEKYLNESHDEESEDDDYDDEPKPKKKKVKSLKGSDVKKKKKKKVYDI